MGRQRKQYQRRAWTPEEIERLIRLSERYTKSDIARIMKRSPSSISSKRHQLNIDSFTSSTDKWNFTQISEAVGLDCGTIAKTWVKHGLKFIRRGFMCLVDEEELLRFMKENPNRWDATKCDYYLFYKYPWFMEKLEQDKKVPVQNRKRFWTDYQKQQFHLLARQGYTHQQIADVIGRSKQAVDKFSMRYGKNEIYQRT